MNETKSSTFFTLFSIILVLCLLGLYGIISLHASNITNILKENLNLIVELKGADQAQILVIQENIKELPDVKSETVRFVSKDEALEKMNEELGEDYLLNNLDNPFYDIILFNVKYDYIATENLDALSETIELFEGVSKVSYYTSVYEYLQSNVRRLSRILLIIGMLIAFFAFSLIYSTIQLSLYADRFKIRTMELVGASWNQIRKPFIVKSLRMALISSLVSIGLLIVLLIIVAIQFNHFWSVINWFYITVVFLLMLIFAFFITQLASYMVVNRYLGADKSRFY